MAKHTCNKESEIAILQTDSKWIKQEMLKSMEKIDHMIEVFTKGEGKIAKLNKTIYGNGDKENSVVNKVEKMRDYVTGQKAQLTLLRVGIGLLGALNLGLWLKG